MRPLERRLTLLENRSNIGRLARLVIHIPARDAGPLTGYGVGPRGSDQRVIVRNAGETDEELKERAIASAGRTGLVILQEKR